MTAARYLLSIFKACIALGWASTAAAATLVASSQAAFVLDPLLAFLSCGVSTLAGATALAYRVNILLFEDSQSDDPRGLVRPWLMRDY